MSEVRKLRWRLWRRFRAWSGGFFWMPCPLCGQMFSGREWDDSIATDRPGTYQGICPACSEAGRGELNSYLAPPARPSEGEK